MTRERNLRVAAVVCLASAVLALAVYALWRRSQPGQPSVSSASAQTSTIPAEPERKAPAEANIVPEFADDFDAGKLDEGKWAVTRKHDFAEFAVDVSARPDGAGNGRLRLRCGTRGTDDKTVKSLGVASRDELDLTGSKRLSLDFDWNNQANGCYLTGAVYLCPTLTQESPETEAQWVRIEYVGVPPGKNARLAVWLKNETTPKWVYDEGWPKEQKAGRAITSPRLEIRFDGGEWTLSEDGRQIFESTEKWRLPFDKAHLYLQMTSHSNYPPRELFFDNVRFEKLGVQPP